MMVYNTLTKRKEPFHPLRPGEVRIYVCGPTVYDYIHIGNARSFVAFDVVRRYLEYKGFKVKFVSNITDVDDKTIRRAKELNITLQQLGELYTEAYFEDLKALRVKKADVNPRATQHIGEMIALIEKLIEKGYAYVVEGNVYYDVTKFPEYGKLSGVKVESLIKGARVEVDPNKRNPADFALWKSRKPGEPFWYSPWGPGRPGWHIECSVMSSIYLGETFDIHAGGKDLIFPHHENEIAQSEAASGKPLARYWLHNEWLTINGEKMSKSLGNFITVRDAVSKYGAQTLRMFLISAHYRSPIDFNERTIEQARRNLEKIRSSIQAFRRLRELETQVEGEKELLAHVEDLRRRFEEAMDDDFNTPKALAAIFDFISELNEFTGSREGVSRETKGRVLKVIEELLDGVLGIETKVEEKEVQGLSPKLVELILEVRNVLRRRRDYETADFIRSKLEELGFVIEDSASGTRWKFKG
ncbi:cysteine--tRNA ligase [Candidatus Bathyarchaeota archaeon B24-2]|nr:MAG: cysteine--tRNA ligase [Candidatus Bathyarchaeota archaeon B24-2]